MVTGSEIPEEYKKFEQMFKKPDDAVALPEHQEWDHEIPIVEGEKPPFEPLRRISKDDLKTLREYLDKNLAKGFIRPSILLVRALVVFALKKDRAGGTTTKRFYIDYRKLNTITVKNRYLIPRIDDLRDRLGKVKVFTKLDLRGAYNLIKIKDGKE